MLTGPNVDLAFRLLHALRLKPEQSTPALARKVGLPLPRVRLVMLWLEAEADVERAGLDGSATVWRIPEARRVQPR